MAAYTKGTQTLSGVRASREKFQPPKLEIGSTTSVYTMPQNNIGGSIGQSYNKMLGPASNVGGISNGIPSMAGLEAASMRLADAAAKREADLAAKKAGFSNQEEMDAFNRIERLRSLTMPLNIGFSNAGRGPAYSPIGIDMYGVGSNARERTFR